MFSTCLCGFALASSHTIKLFMLVNFSKLPIEVRMNVCADLSLRLPPFVLKIPLTCIFLLHMCGQM